MQPDTGRAELIKVARGLGGLLPHVAFVGGVIIELYLPATPELEMRATTDVDCVIEAATIGPMHKIEQRLRDLGFTNDMSDGAHLCRWKYGNTTVDIMPADEQGYGSSNRWYNEGLRTKKSFSLDGIQIWIFPLPVFVACKFEAFLDRGKGDYFMSHDWEDIVMVLAESTGMETEWVHASPAVKAYLRGRAIEIMGRADRDEIIYSQFDSDKRTPDRLARVIGRLELMQA